MHKKHDSDKCLATFQGHAFVSGFRHFSTFDKEHFDFSSSCQTTYLLATDMRNHNFTVTMSAGDRNNGVPAAIELIVENRRVAVFSDYNVKLNGQRRSLPLVDDKVDLVIFKLCEKCSLQKLGLFGSLLRIPPAK